MITKNSSGTNLSANYGTAVATAPRQWQVALYLNGTQLSCGIKRLEITKGACGDTESFAVGNVYASMLTAELLELSTDIKGEDIEVRVGLLTGVGTWEWVTAGFFTAIEVVKTVYSTNVTAYGYTISKTAGGFVVPATLSLSNIASAIQTATGKTVTFDTGINTAYVLEGELESGISCYGGLQVLAHAVGGYAVDTYDGNFAIHKFSDTSTLSVATDRMIQLPNIEEQAFTITGVQVNATGQYSYSLTTDVAIDPDKTYYTRSGTAPDYVYTEVEEPDVADIGTYYERFDVVYTSGSPIVLYDENPNMSADVFSIYDDIVGYSYYTGTIDLSMGDIRIEGNDVLTVTDVDSNTYIVPCHIVKHKYDGGLSTSIQAVKATNDGDGIVSNAPISQQIDQIGVATQLAKESAENAVQYAEIAKQTTDEIVSYADTVGKTVTQVLQDGETARVSAQQASEYASRALGNLSTVQSVAETLTWITQHGTMTLTSDVALDPTHVYFVLNDATGYYTVGAHKYDIVTEPDVADIGTYYVLTIDESLNNYVGTHLALDTEGLWLLPASSGVNKVLIATGAGSTYTTAGTYILNSSGGIEASFRSDGATIGQVLNGYSRTEIGTDGMQIIQRASGSDTEIAHFGYGLGTTQGGGTAYAPYYTLGTRNTTVDDYDPNETYNVGDLCVHNGGIYACISRITTPEQWQNAHWRYYIGNMSVAEGQDVTACGGHSHAEGGLTISAGFNSHAEGLRTKAIGLYSHTEGQDTQANGEASHAEGTWSQATGLDAHAEGNTTTASGNYSHAQNFATIAQRRSQTAIGEFNVSDTSGTETTKGDYVFIIGNGTAEYARSNALTVDWNGNVDASGSVISDTNFANAYQGQGYEVSGLSIAGSTYLGQAINLGAVGSKHPIFNGFDINGTGTARIHTLGHYIYQYNGHWYAYIKMRNDNTSAISNFKVIAYIAWI